MADTGGRQVGVPPPGKRHPSRALAVLGLAMLLVGAGFAIGFFVGRSQSQSQLGLANGNPASTGKLHPIPTTTLAVGIPNEVSVVLPLVVCPTSFAIPQPPHPAALSSTIAETVLTSLTHRLAVYSDDQGTMQLLGPSGWRCQANFGADGSGGVTVYPSGGSPLSSASTSPRAEIVVGTETSACVGCTEGQACPYFASATTAYARNYSMPCPAARAAGEHVKDLGATVVSITDPPGVKGVLVSSGGEYPAVGIMTYNPDSDDGSYLDSCTLPEREQDICSVALATFTDNYGND